VSIYDIRVGLAANLATVAPLNGRVSAYYPDNINPPMGIVDTVRVEFDSAFNRGSDEILVDVMCVVRRDSERVAQAELDALVPLVKAAIQSDLTLGGACDDLIVTALNGYAPLVADESTYLAATFAVRVIATA
jgi:hypothetical protein